MTHRQIKNNRLANDAAPRLADLERVADALAIHTRTHEKLRLVASPGTVWLWLAGADIGRLRTADQAIDAPADIQVAIGSTGPGVDGFRVSHLDAMKTQHAMARLSTDHRVGRFADIEGVLLLTENSDGVDRFIANNLGGCRRRRCRRCSLSSPVRSSSRR